MSQFFLDDNNDKKTAAIPWVFSENSHAKKMGECLDRGRTQLTESPSDSVRFSFTATWALKVSIVPGVITSGEMLNCFTSISGLSAVLQLFHENGLGSDFRSSI